MDCMLSEKTRDGVSKPLSIEDVKLLRGLKRIPDLHETRFEPHSFSNLRHTTTMRMVGAAPHGFCDHARLVAVGFLLSHVSVSR